MPQPVRHLLHVEDDPNDAFFLKRRVERAHLPYAIARLPDGQQALAFFRRSGEYADRTAWPEPDVVLLDLKMPRVDGFELLEWLRAQPAWRTLPVFVVSSSDRPEDRDRAEELGATAYYVKTAEFSDVLQGLSALDFPER